MFDKKGNILLTQTKKHFAVFQTNALAGHLCFKQAQPKMCHSPKVDDGFEIFKESALRPILSSSRDVRGSVCLSLFMY